jgi:hypothetical protein
MTARRRDELGQFDRDRRSAVVYSIDGVSSGRHPRTAGRGVLPPPPHLASQLDLQLEKLVTRLAVLDCLAWKWLHLICPSCLSGPPRNYIDVIR